MNQTEVFKIVDGERTYQESLGSDRTDGRNRTVGDELVLMDVYLRRAFDAWADYAGDTAALEQIRKVAAIAVRCMENHGAPGREY